MINQQIAGVKFRELKDGRMEVSYIDDASNERVKEILSKEEGQERYNIFYAKKYADKVFDEVLDSLGLSIETAHLLTDKDVIYKNGKALTYYYEGIKRTVTEPRAIFLDYMEKALRHNKIDLAYLSTNTLKYNVHIAGNASGIAWDYREFLFDSPWIPCEMTKGDLEDYIKKHKDIIIIEKTHGIAKVDRKCLLSTKFGTEHRNMGYGSQASVISRKIELKKDKKGNLLIESSTEIWD